MQRKALQLASPWLVISPWREKRASALFCSLLASLSLALMTCANPFIQFWWVMLRAERLSKHTKICPLFTALDCWWACHTRGLLDGYLLITCTVWHNVYYYYLTSFSSCQYYKLLNVPVGRHKSGRLRKYHHDSIIRNTGDCVAARECGILGSNLVASRTIREVSHVPLNIHTLSSDVYLPGFNQYVADNKASCSRTQCTASSWWDSNPQALDFQSSILPLIYHAPGSQVKHSSTEPPSSSSNDMEIFLCRSTEIRRNCLHDQNHRCWDQRG